MRGLSAVHQQSYVFDVVLSPQRSHGPRPRLLRPRESLPLIVPHNPPLAPTFCANEEVGYTSPSQPFMSEL